jgi:hypothetical protein
MEHLVEWEYAGRAEVLGGYLHQCHVIHQKSHMNWPEIATGEPASSQLSYGSSPAPVLWPRYGAGTTETWTLLRSRQLQLKKVKLSRNRPWRPIGLWDVEAPTFSRQSAHRWRWGCQLHAPAALYCPGRFLVLISVRSWVDPRAIVRLEGLGQFKNPMTSSRFEPAALRLAA